MYCKHDLIDAQVSRFSHAQPMADKSVTCLLNAIKSLFYAYGPCHVIRVDECYAGWLTLLSISIEDIIQLVSLIITSTATEFREENFRAVIRAASVLPVDDSGVHCAAEDELWCAHSKVSKAVAML